MKFVHLSDTHLGYMGQGLQQLVPAPIPSSELITYAESATMASFKVAVDIIISRVLPDLIIHSGNLFHHARPTPLTLDFAMLQLRRLSEAGIPVLFIEGTHSYPRDRTQGHALQLLTYLPGVSVVYDQSAVLPIGGVTVHAFPHRALVHGCLPDPSLCNPHTHNILVAHAVANGLPFFRTGRSAADLAVGGFDSAYDYIALGHSYHFAQVPDTERAFYAGAMSMVSWGAFRPGYRFGFNVVTLTSSSVEINHQDLPTPAMQRYGLDDAHGLTVAEILAFLEAQVKELPPVGAYCQIIIENLDSTTKQSLSARNVDILFDDALECKLTLSTFVQPIASYRRDLFSAGDPLTRFRQIVEHWEPDQELRQPVEDLGLELLMYAQEQLSREDAEPSIPEGER